VEHKQLGCGMKKRQEIGMLAFLAVVAIIGFALVSTGPFYRDYEQFEYSQWRHQDPFRDDGIRYREFLEARREGQQLRLAAASPFAIVALVLGGLLIRRSRNP
jgi:hypothetical protein